MNATGYCVRNSVCDSSSLASTGSSKNRDWSRNAFGRSALLVIEGIKNVGHCPIVPSPYDNPRGPLQELPESAGLQS
jgi:hypothetical protein